ncbi:DHA2 family efflux MFS transporter permease subunit [Corynebacterium accolens]|uniref:DHA2 family efflux MFS transporter permease subunit n=1 Tax=Corynebacterium accolens TaxID=38284 RepID=UPI002543CA25|nr:DHA2 family efflux MFS transporter permease subunit [Corynebacterium accolens]MDK4266604.1 DHA2 family efflux MFS transporter permease subunit [Corynebacterium accolens]MDK4309566.1 DHA2 family efflux MFS transporter permease subunit [Corynebacterium accolens]MDK8471696.1 DHA2 family efflux MFS transporter permease subunit [Corynebacterium accolens]MDK8617786.1 DHA2 family efflux MFS transporter permease subunit [Corynebacterium accolens]
MTVETNLPPERQAWRAMFALSLGFFVSLLDQSMVAIALPDIQADLGATVNEIMWVSAAYLLAVVVPLLFTGRLGDVLGQRALFCIGVGLFGIGAVACALAPSIEVLIVARIVQGLGASLEMPQTMSIINRVFARERRGRALGVWGIIGSVASLAGPLLGGFLVAYFGWQAAFWVHVPFVIAAIVLALLWIPKLPTTAQDIDKPSAIVSLIALGSIVFGIQQGPELDWDWRVLVVLAIGIAASIAFVRLQASAQDRGSTPLFPVELFHNRNYAAGSVGILTMGFMAASVMLPVMLWLQSVKGLSAGEAGLIVAPMALVSMLMSPIAGILTDAVNPRLMGLVGFSLMIASLCLSWWVMHADANPWWLALPIAGLGIGQSFIWGSNAATTLRDIPPHHMGAASGAYNTSRQVGSVVGVALVSAVMQTGNPTTAIINSILVIVIALVVGLVSSLRYVDTLHG